MSSLVLLDLQDSIATLTLNRPARHNSLVPELLEEISSGLEQVACPSATRAVILQAEGRSFSTGGDLLGFYNHKGGIAAYSKTLVGLLNRVIIQMITLPIPIVAAVHGIVTGGSLGLILGSDIVILTPDSSFTPYYGEIGFSPDGGWTALLPDIIGAKRVAEILMLNLTISAQEAVTLGLAHEIVAPERIKEESYSKAKQVSRMAPGSIKSIKRLLGASTNDLASKLDFEMIQFVEQVQREEALKGIMRYLDLEENQGHNS